MIEPTSLIESIKAYWNEHIHDMGITTQPIGSIGFFRELEAYRFDKLRYLQEIVDSSANRGKQLLEVGCGIGTDLIHFARAGALVTGIDLSEVSIELARRNFKLSGYVDNLFVMNDQELRFDDETYDVVYAHGVLPYTADDQLMIDEIRRVLKPGGEAILMAYNKYSWLNLLSKVAMVELEHQDAPVFRLHSLQDFRGLLKRFKNVHIVTERFPVKTMLHRGLKGAMYNLLFVRVFNLIPRLLVRPIGWHLIAFANK